MEEYKEEAMSTKVKMQNLVTDINHERKLFTQDVRGYKEAKEQIKTLLK